jgi:hypothetical protein
LEDSGLCLDAEPFGDSVQDLRYLDGRCLETGERGVSPGGKLAVAGLAVEILDEVVAPVVAIADEGVDGGVGDAVKVAVRVGAGLAAGIDRFLATPSALALGVRQD